MANRDGVEAASSRIAREVERERQERAQLDEARTNLGAQDDFRTKDARERVDTSAVKRVRGR